MEIKEILKTFCLNAAPSGWENEMHALCAGYMEQYGDCQTDKRGNFICRKEGSGKHFLLDAHLDQIGFTVTAIEQGGFLRLAKVGGIDRRVFSSAEVVVLGKEALFGVIGCKPPHLSEESERDKAPKVEDFFVDTGLPSEILKELVSPGDRVVYQPYFSELLNGNVTGTSIDDRAGMAIIVRVMELLKQNNSNARITAVFSVQEEVNGKGAGNASYYTEAQEAIAVDVSFAEQPETAAHKNSTMPLGGGAFIGFSPLLDREMSRAFVETAKANQIPYCIEVMGGATGTNADEIACAKYGTKTITVSPPIRNMHTAVEVANIEDLENCAKLIAAYILSKEGK